MVGWESIPIFYRVYSYFKKYIDLKERENILVAKDEQLKKKERELTNLREISEENSLNYESMIELSFHDGYIRAEDTFPAPYLEIKYSITNRSIFDFKTERISMNIIDHNTGHKLGQIETPKNIKLPHQQTLHDQSMLQLHPNFISQLKSIKKEGRSLYITLEGVKIDFTGYKDFSKSYGNLRFIVPADDIIV
ncbi:MAG: hypothetical protein WC556_11480 [Candidatus Methanoperedens sp.]